MNTPLLKAWGTPLRRGLALGGLLLATLVHPALAQTADTYVLTASNAPYAPLPAATATNVASIQSDDALSATIPLGFTFTFDGTAYTSVKASSNGWLTFNPAATANSLTNDLAGGAASERPLVAPFWDDLNGINGTAQYLTTGTAPNRTFTFEWSNWIRYGNSTGPSFSMQVKLTEGTNVVRFAYTQLAGAPISNALASIGLSGAGAGPCSFLSLSDAVAAPTTSSAVENSSISVLPPTGQVYTFTPPTPSACPTPRCLAATTLTATTATVTYSVTNTTPGPFTIVYGPAGFNPALPPSTTNVYFTITATGTTANLTGLTALTGYQFYVTQNCGGTSGTSIRSNVGSFTTNPNPAVNDECTTAVALTVAATCTTPTNGAVFGATQSLAPTTNCGGTTANDVWYSFVATSTSHTIMLTPQFDAAYDVRSGACASTTSIYCNTAGTGTATSRTIGGLTVGQPYFIRIYASGTQPTTGPTSTFTLCVVPGPATPANDDCAGAINVPIQFVTCTTQVSADNTAATSSTSVAAPTCANYQGNDIWFKVTVPVSGTVSIQTLPPTAGSSITDTGMSVYSGTCTTLTQIQCDDDSSPNGNYSQVDLTGRTPGEVLYIRVWAYGGNNSGLIAVCVTSPSNCAVPTGPTVTNINDISAVLNWVAPTGSTGNTYEVEYGLQGFTQGTGTLLVGLTTTTRAITGLTPNTGYCFYVRQNCGTANGSSAWVGPTCFSTPLTVPTNDDPCGAIGLGAGVRTGTTIGSTTTVQSSIITPVCSPASQPKDVWYSFVASAPTATFTMSGAPAGMVRVYSSPSCSAGPFTLLSCAASGANNTAITAPVVVPGLTVGTRYYVAVSGYGSSDTGGTFTITPSAGVLATRAQADTEALLVYPNPSNTGQLTLKLATGNGQGQATLLNALGQVVLTKALTGNVEQVLSTRALATGLYTLRVETNGQVLTRKVVLE